MKISYYAIFEYDGKDINISFEKGEIVGLIGPSGTGKTTLIQCMLGMENLDGGGVTIDGVEMPNRKTLMDIGYMAQRDALYEDLTGRENLEFFGSIYIKKRKDINARVKLCSDMVKLQASLDKKVSTYSGGMKRRLSLAISFLQNPKILILDEPTVGIDPKLTHVLDEATRCDKLLLMNHGEIIAMGTPQHIKDQYQADTIEEVFLKMED